MRVDSCRTLFHLHIALSTVLEVVLILPEDKVDWFNDNDIYGTLVPLLYESIVSQLVRGSTVVKKKKDLDETSRSLNQAGMFALSYCFRWHGKARSFLIRTRSHGRQKAIYRSVNMVPYDLHIHLQDPQPDQTLHNYFTTSTA